MAAIYTRRLFAKRFLAPFGEIVYRAPPVGTVVLRDVVLANGATTAVPTVLLQVNKGTASVIGYLGVWKQVPTGTLHLDMRQVLEQGDEIWLQGDPVDLSVWATGYVFE